MTTISGYSGAPSPSTQPQASSPDLQTILQSLMTVNQQISQALSQLRTVLQQRELHLSTTRTTANAKLWDSTLARLNTLLDRHAQELETLYAKQGDLMDQLAAARARMANAADPITTRVAANLRTRFGR